VQQESSGVFFLLDNKGNNILVDLLSFYNFFNYFSLSNQLIHNTCYNFNNGWQLEILKSNIMKHNNKTLY
jgi:hypothetical protein